MSCPFGTPGKGFHSARFMGFSIGDTAGTILLSILISKYYNIDQIKVFIILFTLGELMHWYFSVDTAFIRLFGTSPTRTPLRAAVTTPDVYPYTSS